MKEYAVYDGLQFISRYPSKRRAIAVAREIALNGGSPNFQEIDFSKANSIKLNIFKENERFVIRHPQYGTFSKISKSISGRVIYWRKSNQTRMPMIFKSVEQANKFKLSGCRIDIATPEEMGRAK